MVEGVEKKMYRLSRYANEIEEVTIVKETACFRYLLDDPSLYRGNRRVRAEKKVAFRAYFDTWEEARTAMVARIEARIKSLEESLRNNLGDLEKVEAMTEPRK